MFKTKYAARGAPANEAIEGDNKTGAHASPKRFFDELLVGVLFAAQHDDPEKQDRQHSTYNANCCTIHFFLLSFPDKQ